tara:strand:+ start:417 stop:599 length:183 start_codon:yes stop_codon:yes gene_type:complete
VKNEIEVLNKILCEICGTNCGVLEVRKITRESGASFVDRAWYCEKCLEGILESESDDEEE